MFSTLMSCAARASPSGVAASSRSVSRRSICTGVHWTVGQSPTDGPVFCGTTSVALSSAQGLQASLRGIAELLRGLQHCGG